MDSDETEVVAAAGRGDPDAWEVLYRRVYPNLRIYLLRRVGPDQVEDAVSETMTRAVRGIDGYRPGPAGFDGWLFGIARRVAADHHRRAHRLRRQDTSAACLLGRQPSGPEPSEPLLAAEDRAELRQAFEKLPERDRELLELRVVAGLTVEQVAAVLGKAPGAVRTAQTRALQRLRQLMVTGSGLVHD